MLIPVLKVAMPEAACDVPSGKTCCSHCGGTDLIMNGPDLECNACHRCARSAYTEGNIEDPWPDIEDPWPETAYRLCPECGYDEVWCLVNAKSEDDELWCERCYPNVEPEDEEEEDEDEEEEEEEEEEEQEPQLVEPTPVKQEDETPRKQCYLCYL